MSNEGAIAIYTERCRQIGVEGYTPEHDAAHGSAKLIDAALAYAVQAQDRITEAAGQGVGGNSPEDLWPWDIRSFKFTDSELASLAKAGALLAAAYDARLREITK